MLVVVSFFIALTLGISGFMAEGLSFSNALYKSAQLFVVSGGDHPDGIWQIEFARFLAPITLSAATLRGIFAIARNNSGVIGGRLFNRGHIILVGGTEGIKQGIVDLAGLAKSPAYLNGRRLVQISANPDRLPRALALAGSRQCSEIVVAVQDDEETLATVHLLTKILDERTHHQLPPVHAELKSWRLWSQIQRIDFAGQSGTTWFNQDEVAAQMLKEQQDELASTEPTLCSTDPEIARLALRTGPIPLLTMRDQATGTGSFRQAIICHRSANDTLINATEVCALLAPGSLLVCICSSELGKVIERIGARDRVEVQVVSPSEWMAPWVEISALEMVARSVHESYRVLGTNAGWLTEDDVSNQPWTTLPASLKVSNRDFARKIADKLESLDACLRPLGTDQTEQFTFSDEELEDLAMVEHERWSAERRAAGWTLGPKDVGSKTSPTLVPWSELSELERGKDRELVRAIPSLLNKFGYEVYR